ncbi:MAG: hypothetical protein FWF44_10720 [Defluviitaleaceae bacterium]|nr:hypothetical protein [Defluviitaleaceae bacterium]
MKRAVLGNKQLKIPDEEAVKKAAEGFDIYDAEGKTLEIPGAGRTVPFARYFELEQRYKVLGMKAEALARENAEKDAEIAKLNAFLKESAKTSTKGTKPPATPPPATSE